MDEEDAQPRTVGPMEGRPRVRLSERRLVEWVAQAKVGDPFPEPWANASDPRESVIRTLVQLGVIGRPAPDAAIAAVAEEATAAARAWLEEHPA